MTDLSRKTPAQKQSRTINNLNAFYVAGGPLTDLERTQWVTENHLEYVINSLDGHMAKNFERLGLAGLHQDAMEQMRALLAAVRAAGDDRP